MYAGSRTWDKGCTRAAITRRSATTSGATAGRGGDAGLGSYVLSTMAMRALMRGSTSQAVDMARGADEHVPSAEPRVLGFAGLVAARGHARAGDRRSASTCLSQAEQLRQRGDGATCDRPPGQGPPSAVPVTPTREGLATALPWVAVRPDTRLPGRTPAAAAARKTWETHAEGKH